MKSAFECQQSVSIVVPFFNELDVIDLFLSRLIPVLSEIKGMPVECIFVDDGSSDGSYEKLCSYAMQRDNFIVIKLSRNFGHQMALTAGLDHAKGSVVVTLDCDLQDPPELLPELISSVAAGHDVVWVTRSKRAEGFIYTSLCRLFYKMLSFFSETRIELDSGDFCAMSSRVVEVLKISRENHRFLRGLRSWSGFKQTSIRIDRPPRAAGRSKYPLHKLISLGLDGILAFSTVPLRLVGFIGLSSVLLSLIFAVYSIVLRIFSNSIPTGFTAIVTIVIFCSGVQMISLATIGAYIGRIYQDTKRRPLYLIDQVFKKTGA